MSSLSSRNLALLGSTGAAVLPGLFLVFDMNTNRLGKYVYVCVRTVPTSYRSYVGIRFPNGVPCVLLVFSQTLLLSHSRLYSL